MQKQFEDREAEEALRRRQKTDARKQHGCEAEMLGAAADHPEDGAEDGPADEQPGATATQVHGEDEGGVPPRRDLLEPVP